MNALEILKTSTERPIIACLKHVNKAGTTRKIAFYVNNGKSLLSLNAEIAERLNLKTDKDNNVIVKGCGQDMVWSTLYDFFACLGIDNKNVNYQVV